MASEEARLRRIEEALMERWLRHDEERLGLAEALDEGPNAEAEDENNGHS